MAGAAAGAPGPAGHYEQARLHGGFVFSAGMTPKDTLTPYATTAFLPPGCHRV